MSRPRALALLAAPVMLAVAVQSAANLVFHAVVGRQLSPAEYGALGALLAAITLVAVPLSALQTSAAHTTATHGLTRGTALRTVGRSALVLTGVAALVAAASPAIAAYLDLDSLGQALLLAPALLVAGLLAVLRGLYLGIGRTLPVAGSYLMSTGARLALGLPLAHAWGVPGALIGTVLGEFLAVAYLGALALGLGTGGSHNLAATDLLRTTAMLTGLFLFSTLDLFMARNQLPNAASGSYVAAATIGKTVLALPAAAISLVYARYVAAWRAGAGRQAVMRAGLATIAVPALGAAFAVIALPGLVLSVLYGSVYQQDTGLVRLLALNAGFTALVQVLAHASLARNSWWAQLGWASALGQGVLIAMLGTSATRIALVSLATTLVTLGLLALWEFPRWRDSCSDRTQTQQQPT